MQRIIYDLDTKKIIQIIDPCDGTVTGTPYEMVEGTAEEIAALIKELGLQEQ